MNIASSFMTLLYKSEMFWVSSSYALRPIYSTQEKSTSLKRKASNDYTCRKPFLLPAWHREISAQKRPQFLNVQCCAIGWVLQTDQESGFAHVSYCFPCKPLAALGLLRQLVINHCWEFGASIGKAPNSQLLGERQGTQQRHVSYSLCF